MPSAPTNLAGQVFVAILAAIAAAVGAVLLDLSETALWFVASVVGIGVLGFTRLTQRERSRRAEESSGPSTDSSMMPVDAAASHDEPTGGGGIFGSLFGESSDASNSNDSDSSSVDTSGDFGGFDGGDGGSSD